MNVKEYNTCVELYADSVYRFVLKNIKNSAMAQDIVQDSFEKLWIKVAQVDFTTVKSYLFSIAYHTMIDAIRKQPLNYDIHESESLHPKTSNNFSEVKQVLNKALDKLPEIQKVVITLRDYEGYSYDEISQITGLNESQVKVYIYRARVFLKNYLVQPENVI